MYDLRLTVDITPDMEPIAEYYSGYTKDDRYLCRYPNSGQNENDVERWIFYQWGNKCWTLSLDDKSQFQYRILFPPLESYPYRSIMHSGIICKPQIIDSTVEYCEKQIIIYPVVQ